MRYFFLAYALVALTVVGIFGVHGQKFTKPPIRIFPDMDEQDKLRAQKPDPFFADGHGGRLPVTQTQPRGFNPTGEKIIGGIHEYEFGGQPGYYYSGRMGEAYGNGMPEELKLDDKSAEELIRRGAERFGIYCAVCHGTSGNGEGITASFGVPVNTNVNAKLNSLVPGTYPDGRLFETISKGMGRMSGYAQTIPVRDRWAIIAYIHTLQAAKAAAPAP